MLQLQHIFCQIYRRFQTLQPIERKCKQTNMMSSPSLSFKCTAAIHCVPTNNMNHCYLVLTKYEPTVQGFKFKYYFYSIVCRIVQTLQVSMDHQLWYTFLASLVRKHFMQPYNNVVSTLYFWRNDVDNVISIDPICIFNHFQHLGWSRVKGSFCPVERSLSICSTKGFILFVWLWYSVQYKWAFLS